MFRETHETYGFRKRNICFLKYGADKLPISVNGELWFGNLESVPLVYFFVSSDILGGSASCWLPQRFREFTFSRWMHPDYFVAQHDLIAMFLSRCFKQLKILCGLCYLLQRKEVEKNFKQNRNIGWIIHCCKSSETDALTVTFWIPFTRIAISKIVRLW